MCSTHAFLKQLSHVSMGFIILIGSSCGGDTDKRFSLDAFLKASNTGAGDQFGRVALSGDTLAVGVPGEASAVTGINGDQSDNSALNSGAVFIFKWTGGGWIQQAYLKASNADAGDVFGFSVALDRDTLVVGAPHEGSAATGINGNQADNTAPNSGAAYVFTRTGGIWAQQAYIKSSNSESGDLFGSSVALYGDTLAVGASSEASAATGINGNQADNTAPNSGAVYVFTRTGGLWTQQAYVKASNTGVGDQFGENVALDGDTLAVGADQEDSAAIGIDGNQADNSAPSSGAVYVFARTAGIWTQQAYLKASNTETGDLFGRSVALSGNTLAVGASSEASAATGINGNQADNTAPNSGAVYVFTRTGGLWTQQAYVKSSNSEAQDGFGQNLRLENDTLAVGASGEDSAATGINGNTADNSAPNSGAVYVFTRTTRVWTQQAYVKASNTGVGDQFGGNVALDGDTLAVGADQEDSAAIGIDGNQADNSAAGSGAVYVYVRK